MQRTQRTSEIAMSIVDGLLMVQAPGDFEDNAFHALRKGVLDQVYGQSLRGVMIDVSALEIIDSVGFNLLARTVRTVEMLGAKAVLVGFQPGVVSALIDLEVEFENIPAAREITDAIEMLRPKTEKQDDNSDDEEVDKDTEEEAPDTSDEDNEVLDEKPGESDTEVDLDIGEHEESQCS